MSFRALSHADIAASASLPDLIPVIAAAMRQVSERRVEMPLRFLVPVGPQANMGVMTGAVADTGFGAKLLSLMPREHGSSHTGTLILFDVTTGEPAAIMESGLTTAMRTAAASAVATDALARRDAAVLAILGTGEQAAWHIVAMRAVRPIHEIRIWGRHPDKARALVARHDNVRAVDSIDQACAGADIICTATNAAAAFLDAGQLPKGVHLNAVGASLPHMREIAPECWGACHGVVDYRPSADTQAGDLIAARAAGIVVKDALLPEIGEILLGRAPGRTSVRQRTLYRSLGIIAQDLAAANFFLRRAEARDRGTLVNLYAEGP